MILALILGVAAVFSLMVVLLVAGTVLKRPVLGLGIKKCRFCGLWMSILDQACQSCGRDQLIPDGQNHPSHEGSKPDAGEGVMFCARCGTRAEDTCVFCMKCGHRLRSADDDMPANCRPTPASEEHTGAQSQTRRVQGRVKWFNNAKGHGFISVPNGSDVFVHHSDILMHYSDILRAGFKTLQEGDRVEFDVVQGTHGPMASGVTRVGAQTHDLPPQDLPRVRGVVKWFKAKEGYGFIGCDAGPDVFLHYSSIQMTGFKFLHEGDVVEFSVVQGLRGPMATRVVKLHGRPEYAETGARPRQSPPKRSHRPAPQAQESQLSPWDILGVPKGASEREISTAYHHIAQMYHPDKVAGLGPEFREIAERKMKEINAAYEELKSRAK